MIKYLFSTSVRVISPNKEISDLEFAELILSLNFASFNILRSSRVEFIDDSATSVLNNF